MKKTVGFALLFALSFWSAGCRAGKESATKETKQPVSTEVDEDPGWPRQITNQGNTLVLYQPQVDDWKNFRELDWRMAFSLTPAGGQEAVGVATLHSNTEIDNDNKMVSLTDLKIVNTSFPSLDPQSAVKMGQLLETFLPPSVHISLYRLIASVPENKPPSGVPLKNDPPQIFVSYHPAILLEVDGQPVRTPIENTQLEYVLNTYWRLFFDKSQSAYFLLLGQQWLRSSDLRGPWSGATTLPKEMLALPGQAQWEDLKDVIPAAATGANAVIPQVFYSERPAEMILFDGQPSFVQIAGTQLKYAENASTYVFLYAPTKHFYYLTAGRWFAASSLSGPWTFATPTLPKDFANIPAESPVGDVLASVPGTGEAKDAVLLAQVPTTMVVDPTAAAAQAKVTYSGDPQFKPIEGTSLSYAANTPDKVIKVGDVYYLCLQGVWFLSSTPQGPWQTAPSVPQVIYTIPPSSPVYNVTYVTQTTTPSGSVQSSYTAGYLGAFVLGAAVGAIVANGTGYRYPPYVYYPPRYGYGYPPVYYPRPPTYGPPIATPYYNTRTGAYGVAQTAYGPYGSATRTASYNPYTGTSTRTVSGSTYYGSRSAGQAYNPYTGTYAATRQGSSPTAQWGSSVITSGNQSAYAQHRTTSQGTVGSIQGSGGGKAVGANTIYGSGAVGKTANGDLYAGKDGNVYRNTGNGWQKYDNGYWNTATSPYSASAQPRAQNSQQKSPATAQTGAPRSAQNYQQRPSNSQVTPPTGQTQSRAQNSQQKNPTTAQTGAPRSAQNYQQRPSNSQVTPPAAQTQPRAQVYVPPNTATTQSAGPQQRAQSSQQQRQQTSNQRAGSSPVPSLQQEAQNRQRGARESQTFQQGQSNRAGRRN
ncbi:MAG: hypothetical protein WCE26_12145 [Candidatus Acidiferrales bacterium]